MHVCMCVNTKCNGNMYLHLPFHSGYPRIDVCVLIYGDPLIDVYGLSGYIVLRAMLNQRTEVLERTR